MPSSNPQDRKRKRSSSQQALPPLFLQKSASSQVQGTDKRTRPETTLLTTAGINDSAPNMAMYSFLSTSSNTGIIDLTSSPSPATPQARMINASSNNRSSLNPHTGAKKLVVKNLKTSTKWDSSAYADKIWEQLDTALTAIFDDRHDGFSKEDLYRGVENVCRQGGAPKLFSRLEGRCRAHVERELKQVLVRTSGWDDVAVLQDVLTQWARWKLQMETIRAIFFFLDRSYLLLSRKPTLSELTPQLFREIVFENAALHDKIIVGTCELVAADRMQQEGVDQELFRQAVSMLHELATYISSFESVYCARTQEFVVQQSDKMVSEKSVPYYVAAADECIATEMRRCEEYALDASTKREILTLLEEHLISRKETDLTEYEPLATLLDHNAFNDLSALYALLNRRKLGNKLRPAFEKWVDETGTSIVESKDVDNMVIQLLSLKRRLDMVWREAFQRDDVLGHGLRESFETFINKTKRGDATWGTDNTKVGEMIAKYVDQLLRGGAKAIPEVLTARRSSAITAPKDAVTEVGAEDDNNDAEMDEDVEINIQLDQVLDLFRFVHGKAVFEAFYKKDLARRLLMQRSASADAEKSMLSRLNTECGSGFTQNLEQMFKDVELAREEMGSYKKRLEDRVGFEKGKHVDLSVNILSAAAWPTYPDVPVIIPQGIKRAIDDFELHYKSKHSGRKLVWKHALAHCQMRAVFAQGSKELVVSSFQAVVLLLFNGLGEDEHLTYQHILSETGLPEPDLHRTLQSLACARLRPLNKSPRGRDISTTDTFSLNTLFTHPKYRLKINQVQLRETRAENKETHERVAEDRNFECQAAIVRILKARKRIMHSELVAEVIKATMSRGVLGVGDIKRNLERLIEKEYCEREEGSWYAYVA